MQIDLAGPAGRLESRLDMPTDAPRFAAVLFHPHPEAGGSLQHRVVHEAAQGLSRAGGAVLRMNFRGVGLSAGRFTGGEGEVLDAIAAIDVLRARFPALPLWTVGYEFGAWIALTTGAAHPAVTTLVGITPPLHAHDFSRVASAGKDVILIHGEDDDVVDVKEVRRFYATLPEPREMLTIGHADHTFAGQAGEVGDALYELATDSR